VPAAAVSIEKGICGIADTFLNYRQSYDPLLSRINANPRGAPRDEGEDEGRFPASVFWDSGDFPRAIPSPPSVRSVSEAVIAAEPDKVPVPFVRVSRSENNGLTIR